MEDLLNKGYAVEVPQNEVGRKDGKVWYLPHHPVVNPNKEKSRIVFDCAAQHRGVSLNSRVLQGPDLTNKLVGVLTRFRLHQVALMADVEAMFHQVRVKIPGHPPISVVATREHERTPPGVPDDCASFRGDVVAELLHLRNAPDRTGSRAPVFRVSLRNSEEKLLRGRLPQVGR